ncbi:tumor necrosis factor receptor superfamily member 9b [Amia ocellicauda]|uniref:tumor necrosis factor receptor superfamily member 9b n=1 Tax=Amia ocellicauda TaxID=2972642 RepID=UPI003463A95E
MMKMGNILLLLGLYLTHIQGVDSNCVQWDPHQTEKGNYCCTICAPGFRYSQECGPKPKELCVPCEEGTFAPTTLSPSCKRCTSCTGKLKVKKNCTAASDTECTCVDGYLCGDGRCSYCKKECFPGQQPNNKRSCDDCPPGTFSNKKNQQCQPWKKSCPGNQMLSDTNGTATSDIICVDPPSTTSANPAIDTLPSEKQPGNAEKIVAFIMAGGTCIGIFILVIACFITSHKKKEKEPVPASTVAPQRSVQQEEDRCSCHCPLQEQGSSMESLDSESKLLSV